MGTTISNYSQFYRGTEQINAYGSGAGRKEKVARDEFNTTDEKGNKVMDKMSKEESFRVMNEISSQYGDDVIVEFSGDGLAALADDVKQNGNLRFVRKNTDGTVEDMDWDKHRAEVASYQEKMSRFEKDAPDVFDKYNVVIYYSCNRSG